MKRFPLFPLSRFPALARAAVGGAVALGLVALGVLLFGSQDEAPEEFSASLLTSGDTTSFKASFDLFYLQSDDPTVGSGTWSIPANAANAAATLDIGLVPNTNESDDFIQVDTAEFLLAGVPTWLAYSSIAASSDAFTVDVVEGAESGGARDITIFVSPEEFSGDGSNPDTTISGVGNLLTGAEVISVNFEIASVQGSVAGDQVGSFDIFGTYVARDADFTRYQLDGNGDGQDGGAGAVIIEDSGIVAPVIASAVPHSSTEIRLTFEKAVDATTAQTAAHYLVYSCDDSVCASPTSSAAPASVAFASDSTKTVVLTLDDADALIDADTDFDASSVAPLNVYAVQASNVTESTGTIAINASDNVSGSFAYHVPDIALVMSAKDTNGNAVTGNIEVYHTLVATVTADTAGSYELHYESGDNPIARCDSPQEHVFNVAEAGVSVVHEFSFESSGTYSFVACGHSDADRVEGVSTPVEVIIAPETIDIQISLAADDDYDGDYDFDTKDSLVFSVTADFSNPSRSSENLSIKVDSCDESSRQIGSGTVTQLDAADVDGTTTQINIAATYIGVNTNGYSVVACVESGMASDESAPVGFSIDWALPVVGAPENATLQTTEETQITVTSDIAGSLIVKAFDASFSSTPSCSTGTTIYSSIEDAESFTVPLIGGLVWDENAKDYHANGLAQGEHTLLACVETAESAYEKQSSAEITVTVEPATAPTVSGQLGWSGTQEMGDDIELTVTSSIKQSTNGTAAYAELFAFESTITANSCADSASAFAQLGNAGDVDATSGKRIFEFNTTDLGAGSYVLRACVTANNATGENTTAWGLEVADYYAPVASLTPVTASIDTTQSVEFTVSEMGDVPVSDGLVANVYDISSNINLTCASDLSNLDYNAYNLTDENNKQASFTLAGDQASGGTLAAGSYTYLACVTRTKGEVDITSEGSTATLTVSPAGAPGVSGATATPSPAYPNDEVTVTATVTQGTSAWDAGEGSATLYLGADSCSAADINGATQLGEVFSLGNSSASGETASFTFDASTLGSFGTHTLRVCASANNSESGTATVNMDYTDYETPTVTATITPASIYTNEQAIIKVESDYDGDVVVYTNESSCDVNSTPVFTGSIDNGDTANIGGSVSFNILGEYHAGGTFAAGDYNFIACVDRGESYGNKTGSDTATLEVQQTEKPVVNSATASPAIAYPDQTVTVTATITDGGSSWNDNEGTATLYMDANSCSDLSGAVPLGDTFFLGASSSTQNATFTFLANDLGSFGTHELHVCASANGSESGSATVDVEYNNLEVTAQMQKSVIDTTQSTNLIIWSNAPASLLELYQTYATSCSVASESDLLTSTNDAGILAMLNTSGGVVFGMIGEHASGGSFAQGNYQFLACVTSEGGSTEVGATAMLEVTSAAPPVVTADTADLGEVYPNQEVTVTATVTEGGSSWTSATANLYLDINSCDAASSDALLVSKALGTSSTSGETVDFSFAATELGAFGQHNLLVCATANDVTSNEANAMAAITYNDFEIPVVDAFVADTSISTAESTTLNITSNIAGTLAVYQTSITSCNALNLPATSHTNATAATSFSVDLVGEHATNGDLAAGTYTYLACVTSTNGKTGGSMDANDAQSATLTVTDVDAASVQLSLSPSGEVAKNTEITATITSDQVNADGADTMATLHKDACDGEQFGLQTLLSGDALSGYEATISFAATETMNMVACATVNGKEGVSDQATITVKEDEVVVVEGEDIKITTTTSSGETATLTADAGQVSSGTTLTLVDLEVEESESLPEEAINAVEIDIDIDDNLNGSLTLGIPTEGNKLEESMELQKWDKTTGEWVTVGEATLSEDGTTYNADITESGKYALVDLAEARKDIDEDGGTVTVEDGDLAGTTVEFPTNAMDGKAQVAVLEPDPSILPDDSLGAVEIVAEQEDFGDKYVTIVIPSAAPGANENPVVTFYDEDDYDKDGITDEWISDGIRNTKFINENIDECKAANGGCAPTPDPLASVGNWFIEFETNHFSKYTGRSEPAPEPGETPVGIRIADGETFRLGYRQTLALRPAGGTGPYTLSVSPADSGSFTDLSGSAITQVAELEDFVFVPDTPVIGNDGRNGIVLTLTDTKGTNDDASDDEQASMTLDLLRRGNMIDLDESFTNGNDGNQVMAGWNESAPFVPTVTGEESGTLSSVGIRLDFSPNKTLRLLRQQTLVFSAGTGDSHAVSLSDSSAGEIVSGNDGTYTFIPSTADNGGKQTTIIITETTDDSQETTAIPVYILARGNTYDKEDSDGLTTGLDANEIMAGWKNE